MEEGEYESDPEEAKLSLKMRRREASDDEEEEERELRREKAAASGDSERESDTQGGAAEYDDEEEEDLDGGDEAEAEAEAEEYYDGEEEEEEYDGGDGGIALQSGGGGGGEEDGGLLEAAGEKGLVVDEGQGQEEKKENEPFAVPTSGAFYMHDDRFRDNAGGRQRRTFGGRKLWESKDDRKWGHDKFEELNMLDRNYDEGRRYSKGNYRGRGKTRGSNPGYVRGNRRGYASSNSQNLGPKTVRGRGPRRYQPSTKMRGEGPPTRNKQSSKAFDRTSRPTFGRAAASETQPNIEPEPVPSRKVLSSLSSASPPFYPSGSSSKETALVQRREVQTANANRNVRLSSMDDNFSMPQSNPSSRGKNVVDSIGLDRLHIDDSASHVTEKPLANVHFPPSASSSSIIATHASQSRAQGKGVARPSVFQPSLPGNQVNKVPPSNQVHAVSRSQRQGQLVGQRPAGASQGSPPKAGLPVTTSELGDAEYALESGKSKATLAGKGKGTGTIQGGGSSSFLYGGAQVMGPRPNTGAGNGDQNFPTFLPVMQFGGQRTGGMGVPAVGMAFPGYVTQPQLGVGNSEMTWLPVLTGAAGALGATYCSPYISVDGAFNARAAGQTSALPASSKDSNQSKPNNDSQPQQRSESTSDEINQRQNKPRRYSEMNFGQ